MLELQNQRNQHRHKIRLWYLTDLIEQLIYLVNYLRFMSLLVYLKTPAVCSTWFNKVTGSTWAP